jgi:hypothetical protein
MNFRLPWFDEVTIHVPRAGPALVSGPMVTSSGVTPKISPAVARWMSRPS